MADVSNRQPDKRPSRSSLTRRGFLKGVGAAAVATDGVLAHVSRAADIPADVATETGPFSGSLKITLDVNRQSRSLTIEPRTTLLSALRDRLEPPVTGPKLVCDAGTCGACTVLLEGKPVYGCSVLAIDCVGKSITTVEGFGTPENLSPVQAAFVAKDAMMCGYCTSGFVTTVTALLQKNPDPTIEQVREACHGNFCRCGTYPHIFAAALSAAKNNT